MKNILLLLIFALCVSPALASPISSDDADQLRTAQRELLDTLVRQSESGELSAPEMLLEIESMMKHFDRVQQQIAANPSPQNLATKTLGSAHQAYLKSYQQQVAGTLGLAIQPEPVRLVLRP